MLCCLLKHAHHGWSACARGGAKNKQLKRRVSDLWGVRGRGVHVRNHLLLLPVLPLLLLLSLMLQPASNLLT